MGFAGSSQCLALFTQSYLATILIGHFRELRILSSVSHKSRSQLQQFDSQRLATLCCFIARTGQEFDDNMGKVVKNDSNC